MDTSSHLNERPHSRRRFLGLLGGTAVALGSGGYLIVRDRPIDPRAVPEGTAGSTPGAPFVPIEVAADVGSRTLVVIEMRGGNDGLATLVPYGNGTLRDLRPELGPATDELVIVDDNMGLHPALAPLYERGLAVVQGVGVADPDGSHFGMEQRWWAGAWENNELGRTGFLGRLCDQLDAEAPMTGVSLGGGHTPALYSDKASTLGIRDPGVGWFLTNEDPFFANLVAGLGELRPDGSKSELLAAASTGLTTALDFADVVAAFEEEELRGYDDGGALSWPLALAATMLDSDLGVKVIHVPIDGFDTHDGQDGNHGYLMEQIGSGVANFLDDLSERGLADSTLIATTSEFGRRPEQNGSGTDHGSSSVALLAGPVVPGLHGESPSLTRLTEDDNLETTVTMGEYYATLSSWFDIAPSEVLGGAPGRLDGLLR